MAAGSLVVGTLAVLVVLEVLLRLAGVGGPAGLDAEFDRPSASFVPHPERQERWLPEGEPVLKVAVVGDSFTAGFGNEWYDAYPNRLEHLLNINPQAPPAVVRTFARPGTNTWQQLRFLDQVVAWGPDLLILGVFLNDTEDGRDRELARYRDALSIRVPSGWALRLLRASRLAAWVHLRLEARRTYQAALDLQEHVFAPGYSGFELFRRALGTFARTCRENDIDLVAVVWPSMGGLGPDYPHRLAHERLAKALRRARIPRLDLLDEFLDKSPLRLAVYPGVDNHPNEIGHRIGATAIYRFLVLKGYVGPAYRSVQKRRASSAYWLRRVQRQRSPLFLAPRPGRPDAAPPEEITDNGADGGDEAMTGAAD